VLAPKLCIECSRYVTRGRGKNLSKKATSTYTYTRPCTQNWRIMFELTKRSIYFCPFYSCARYRVLDLHRTGFVVSHPTLAGVIPNNNLYWKPVSLCVVHSDTSTRLIVYFKVILSTYYIGFIILILEKIINSFITYMINIFGSGGGSSTPGCWTPRVNTPLAAINNNRILL